MAETNMDYWNALHDRAQFEKMLRSRPQMEYMVVGTPQPIPGKPENETTKVWVLRKQDRRGDAGPNREYNETETLETYYVVDVNVYQAPSVADVIENRMLSAMNSMNKFYELAKSLPTFSPTQGYTYQVENKKPPPGAASTTGTPARSREGSVAPGADSQSLRSTSVAPNGPAASNPASTDDTALLLQSLNMAIAYADDYMDENPLIGEPGNFKFTTTTAAIKKRKADEEAAAKKAREQKESASRVMSPASSPKPEKAPSPPAIFTEAKTAKTDKEKKEEKKKRRKSRPNATSPTTPASASSTGPPPPAG
jgi:mediator of RNA polymerase II transcription subunit 6